jgi:hypothetical protein
MAIHCTADTVLVANEGSNRRGIKSSNKKRNIMSWVCGKE